MMLQFLPSHVNELGYFYVTALSIQQRPAEQTTAYDKLIIQKCLSARLVEEILLMLSFSHKPNFERNEKKCVYCAVST